MNISSCIIHGIVFGLYKPFMLDPSMLEARGKYLNPVLDLNNRFHKYTERRNFANCRNFRNLYLWFFN